MAVNGIYFLLSSNILHFEGWTPERTLNQPREYDGNNERKSMNRKSITLTAMFPPSPTANRIAFNGLPQ